MGAASVDLPTMVLSSGPMLNGKFRGRDIGSGTDVWRLRGGPRRRDDAGRVPRPKRAWRAAGHCMTMGTASTMACLIEALGMQLPGNAALPGGRLPAQALAHIGGRRIVQLVKDDVRLSQIAHPRVLRERHPGHAAIGGSTNAVVHLLALAGRLGVPLAWTISTGSAATSPAGRPDAVRAVPDGGLLLRRRRAGAWSRTGRRTCTAARRPSPAGPSARLAGAGASTAR